MMVIDPADNGTQRVLIDNKAIERMNELVTVDSNSTTYIKARLVTARHAITADGDLESKRH